MKKKHLPMEGQQLQHLNKVREIYRTLNTGSPVLVVSDKNKNDIFQKHHQVMQLFELRGLLQVKSYDSLSEEDLDKHIIEV